MLHRLQKVLANAGIASRRQAESLIVGGHVRVNGNVVSKLGSKVDPDHDRVEVNSIAVTEKPKTYLAINKPKGYTCSRRRQGKGRIVHDLLGPELKHLHPVGRLDQQSEGLLLLTNDGDLTLRLTHPRYGVLKRYRVTVDGRMNDNIMQRLEAGIQDRGDWLQARSCRLLNSKGTVSVLEVELTDGKNREIRRMMASVGCDVLRLLRTEIGGLGLRGMLPGRWRYLDPEEVRGLMGNLIDRSG